MSQFFRVSPLNRKFSFNTEYRILRLATLISNLKIEKHLLLSTRDIEQNIHFFYWGGGGDFT